MSLSKPAVPVVNRRARSVRSASGQSDVGEDTTQTLAELGLDVVGEDDMEKQLWVMVGKKQVMQFPDRRKCILCPFRDNMWCPTALKLHQLKRYVRWDKGPTSDGKTQGQHCHKCTRYILVHVSKASCEGITIIQYEQTLSLDISGALMKRHESIIVAAIKKEIETGVEEMVVDWADLEKEADAEHELTHSNKYRKTKPVAQVYSLTDYEDKYGCLETNGFKDKGHRYIDMDG